MSVSKEKKYVVLNILIVILSMVLFVMVVGLIFSTTPGGSYYDKYTSGEMLRSVNFSGYQAVSEYRNINEALGIYSKECDEYMVPYAIADYYEAAFCDKGYRAAGEVDKAGDYENAMDDAKGRMGEYTFFADEIDVYLGLD
jgi:hypothetical protein